MARDWDDVRSQMRDAFDYDNMPPEKQAEFDKQLDTFIEKKKAEETDSDATDNTEPGPRVREREHTPATARDTQDSKDAAETTDDKKSETDAKAAAVQEFRDEQEQTKDTEEEEVDPDENDRSDDDGPEL